MPKVSETHLKARRQQILDAARRCFGNRGFHQTTMQEIYQEAGLSAGSIYRYFASKEELIAALAEEAREKRPVQREATDPSRGQGHSLCDIFEAQFAVLHRSKKVVEGIHLDFDLFSESKRNERIGEIVQSYISDYIDTLASVVEESREAGRAGPSLDARSIAIVLSAQSLGLFIHQLVQPEVDIEAVIQTFYALLGKNENED